MALLHHLLVIFPDPEGSHFSEIPSKSIQLVSVEGK